MNRMLSLRRTLLLLLLALFVVVQISLFVTIYQTSSNTIDNQIKSNLDATTATFERIVTTRIENLTQSASLLAKDFGFREAIATNDLPTAQSALSNILQRGAVDLAVLYDLDGNAVTHVTTDNQNIALQSAVQTIPEEIANPMQPSVYFVQSNAHLYEGVLVPIKAPILIGWIALGERLDNTEADETIALSAATADIAFMFKAGDTWKISGMSSSGETEMIKAFIAKTITSENKPEADTDSVRNIEGYDYALRYVPFPGEPDTNKRFLLLTTPLDVAEAPYRPIFIALAIVSFVGLGVLSVGSFLISSRVARPLTDLASIASKIRTGTYDDVQEPSDYREIYALSHSFNEMIAAIQEREEKITHQACHDIMSGLPNRVFFETQMLTGHAARSKDFAVVIAEIQELQSIRMLLDHEKISELAQKIGDRLTELTGCQAAHLSTDSFGFIIDKSQTVETLMPGIIQGFEKPFQIGSSVIDVGLLYGVEKNAPEHSAVDLILNAYSAIDQAREGGKRFAFYNPDERSMQDEHLSLMSDLREDMKNGHVSFAYQPKLDIASGKVTGGEALIRWISPKHGFVSPEVFIPLVEKIGDITQLTEWILETTMRQAAVWYQHGRNIKVSINLSTRDLQNENLPDQVAGLLRQLQLPSKAICLEVTESAVMGDMDKALAILEKLSQMGITLSVDDYGTGYSSLAYLKRLPVEELKIDKAFVLKLATSDADKILVKSTIDLAHNLGMRVTAEGVEDQESLEYLREHGCDVAQGYYIARPMAVSDFEAFLEDHNGT